MSATLTLPPPAEAATDLLPAIGYGRISRDDQRKGLGVGRQTDDIEGVFTRENLSPLVLDDAPRGVFTENDVSASRYATSAANRAKGAYKVRPKFAKVLELIRAGLIARLVVYNLDRLLRQPRELEDLIDLVESLPNFLVLTVTGTLDLRSREGRMFARMQVAMAASEADATSERLRRTYDQKAAEGLPKGTGRARAFGYQSDGMTLHEAEAEAFKDGAEGLLSGETPSEVLRALAADGFVSAQTGRPLTYDSIREMFTNPRHAGLRVHRGKVVGEAKWPALVTLDQHRRLVALFNDPSRKQGPRGAASEFAGLIVNVEGRKLRRTNDAKTGRKRWGTRPEYPGDTYLSVSIKAEPLEAHVLDLFFAAVDDGSLTERVNRSKAKAAQKSKAPDPAEIESDLEFLSSEFGAGRMTRGEWQSARKPLLARLESAQKAQKADSVTSVLSDLTNLRERWDDFSNGRKREYLSAAFECIVVHESRKHWRHEDPTDRIEPRWRL